MMTLSGQLVTQSTGAPTLEDIAIGLSRLPRFAGQTITPWTVAHHSVVCHEIALKEECLPCFQLDTLLHDAHECLTGDIPTSFKTPDMRALQHQLSRRLYDSLNLSWLLPAEEIEMKAIDRRVLLAEAYVVAPKATYERISEETGRLVDWGDLVIVQGVLGEWATEAEIRYEYLARVKELLLQRRGINGVNVI
jgi:hypothetical protein